MNYLLETVALARHFQVSQGMFKPRANLQALNGVDLRLGTGEVLGIAGESGCGKSTPAKILLNLLAPSEGNVQLDGKDISTLGRMEFTRTMAGIVTMPLRVHGIGTDAERRTRAAGIMDMAGLPARFAERYPKELSGGQRQRVALAHALVINPT